MCNVGDKKGDTDWHIVVMPECQPVTLLGFNWGIGLTVHRFTAVLRSKINMQKEKNNPQHAIQHNAIFANSMQKCSICPLQATQCVSTHILRIDVLIHRLFSKCAFWGMQEGAGLQQCSVVQLGACMGAMTSFQTREFPTILPALFGPKVGHQGDVTVTHMKQQKHATQKKVKRRAHNRETRDT